MNVRKVLGLVLALMLVVAAAAPLAAAEKSFDIKIPGCTA
jgi:hypothetical protein